MMLNYIVFFAYNSNDLQVVCDRLTVWAEEWQLRIAYNKCISHRISNRAGTDGNSGYRIGSHVLCWSDETHVSELLLIIT